MAAMKVFASYFILGLSALLPLINPPGSALELLSVVGIGADKPYRLLARKIAINTALFLAIVAFAGPYVLRFFGISIPVLRLVGGAVVAAMGWSLLNTPSSEAQMKDPGLRSDAENCVANFWKSMAFYPLTFPVTVGPGSVAVTLTLAAQAKGLELSSQIAAFVGLFACIAALCSMVFVFYAYAPYVAEKVPAALANGVLRITAFLLICIGVEIAWHGLHSLLVLPNP